MPALPTFTVTDAVASRIMAAFSGQVDANNQPMPPATAYKAWLKRNIIDHVTQVEQRAAANTMSSDLTT